ncbi:MAG TPA: hypothetical protein VL221_05655 [Bacteroidota bacterium]|nr:hypothetical protein [Bacteroidota bacterium]
MMHDEMRAGFEECAARLSAHLIDLVVRGARGNTIVELFIDAEEGVTTELCSAVSREAALLIDRERWIQGSYRLEVSSPGIARPLRFLWQYKKHVGRTLSVRQRTDTGEANRSGRLVSVGPSAILLETAHGDSPLEIPFDSLVEAVVKSPW